MTAAEPVPDRSPVRETTQPEGPRPPRLPARVPEEGLLAGVCAGLAQYFGTDVRAVRLAFVLLVFGGVGVMLYAVLWALMPPPASGNAAARH